MKDQIIIFGASLLWIAFCMRFWWVINRENVWQRRLIAIAAGLGGGLIYMFGSMAMQVMDSIWHRDSIHSTNAATLGRPSSGTSTTRA